MQRGRHRRIVGSKEARQAVKSATFFSFFLPDPVGSKRTVRQTQCGSSGGCAAGDLRCMYAFFWLGRDQDHDQDQHEHSTPGGLKFLRRRCKSRQSTPSANNSQSVRYQLLSSGDMPAWRGALSSLASFPSSGRASTSGEEKQQGQGGFAGAGAGTGTGTGTRRGGTTGSGTRGRCKVFVYLGNGGSGPLIEEGRPMWCEATAMQCNVRPCTRAAQRTNSHVPSPTDGWSPATAPA